MVCSQSLWILKRCVFSALWLCYVESTSFVWSYWLTCDWCLHSCRTTMKSLHTRWIFPPCVRGCLVELIKTWSNLRLVENSKMTNVFQYSRIYFAFVCIGFFFCFDYDVSVLQWQSLMLDFAFKISQFCCYPQRISHWLCWLRLWVVWGKLIYIVSSFS